MIRTRIIASLMAFALGILACGNAYAAATLLPPAEACFAATTATSGGTLGPIFSQGLFSAGSGYVNGTYTNVPLTGGSGFGALATINVSGNVVVGVSVTNPGSHYAAGDTLSVANTSIGGSGTGFSIPVSSVRTTGTGLIGQLGPITGGSGGTTGTYGGVALTGGAGSGAIANITVSGGIVTAVVIVNPGVGFVVGDTLSAASANIGNVSGFSVQVSSVSINQSLAGGQVYFYQPNTNIFKSTWFNPAATSGYQNTNPVQLDANGCAIIYGTGSYRQVLQDSLGNTIWDQITTDTSANNNTFWAGQAGGTPNAITVVDPGFNATDGSVINFVSLSANTGPTTLNPSGYGNVSITKPTNAGPVALAAGDVPAGTIISVVYSATAGSFQLLSPPPSSVSATAAPSPQGYLTLSSDPNNVIITTDVTGATSLYYTPFTGNQIPIWNGSNFVSTTFSQLTLTLASGLSTSTIYDTCVFLNNGIPVLVTGPAWSSSTPGSSARGTGSGSAQIQRQNGIWVNTNQITGLNGANSYTIPAEQCTYLGSIFTDSGAVTLTNNLSYGQSRRWDVWNTYNRQPIKLLAGDSTASWAYAVATIRSSNGNSANSVTAFTGLAEESVSSQFTQRIEITSSASAVIQIGIGLNSTTVFSGQVGTILYPSNSTPASWTPPASFSVPPSLGVNTINELENSEVSGTVTFFGTNTNMQLTASWRG